MDALTDLQWPIAPSEVSRHYSDKEPLQQTSDIAAFCYFQLSGIGILWEMQTITAALTDCSLSTAHGEVISHYSGKNSLQQISRTAVLATSNCPVSGYCRRCKILPTPSQICNGLPHTVR